MKILYIVIIIIVGLVLLVSFNIKDRNHITEKMQENHQVWNARKQGPGIFVVLPAYNIRDAEISLHVLLTSAFQPQRLHFGCVYNPRSGKPNLNNLPSGLEHLVSFLPEQSALTLGASVARHRTLTKLYNREPYICFLTSHVRSVPHWDEHLINNLREAQQLGAHVLSVFPPNVDDEDACLDGAPPTFPVLDELKAVPIFQPRVAAERALFRTPMISFKCLFGEGALLIAEIPPLIPFLNVHEDNFVLSTWFHCRGLSARTTKTTLFFHVEHKSPSVIEEMLSSELIEFKRNIITKLRTGNTKGDEQFFTTFPRNHTAYSFFELLGIDFLNKHVAGRSKLGLAQDFTQDEIILKYGSIEVFQTHKSKFCY